MQIADNTVVLKRMNANARGNAGSLFTETRSKVEHDLLTGRATAYETSYGLYFDGAYSNYLSTDQQWYKDTI